MSSPINKANNGKQNPPSAAEPQLRPELAAKLDSLAKEMGISAKALDNMIEAVIHVPTPKEMSDGIIRQEFQEMIKSSPYHKPLVPEDHHFKSAPATPVVDTAKTPKQR